MAVNKFKFVSPGIFLNEVDESQIPAAPELIGPTIIGRFRKGPAMRAVKVRSYTEFVGLFGDPMAGPEFSDVWRSGVPTGPTYAAYAAKAWLAAGSAPATVVRVLGEDHGEALSAGNKAGWNLSDPSQDRDTNGGTYGLFIINSGAHGSHLTGTLGAVWYMSGGTSMILSGNARGVGANTNFSGSCVLISNEDSAANKFKTVLYEGDTPSKTFVFDFDRTSGQYIRNQFNTDPSLTNTSITNTSNISEYKNLYWLGETFERSVSEATSGTAQWGMILPLKSGSAVWSDRKKSFTNAQTSWFFSQDFGVYSDYQAPRTCTKLFKIHALDLGSWANANLKIGIEDIRGSTTPTSPFGTFTVAVYPARATDKLAPQQALERFTKCDLNPDSANFVARRIGDKSLSWSDTNKKHTSIGYYPNQSRYIRVEVNQAILDGAVQKAALPFGVSGELVPQGFSYSSGSAFFVSQSALPASGGTGAGTRNSVEFVTYASGGFENISMANTGTIGHAIAYIPNYINVGSSSDAQEGFSGSWAWPRTRHRSSSADAGDPGKKAFFGVQATEASTTTRFDVGYGDYTRGLPTDSAVTGRFDTLTGAPAGSEYAWTFSLDELMISGGNGIWVSGSRRDNRSVTAVSSSYKKVLNDYDRFWAPMYGGLDGFDIIESEPLRNSGWASTTTNIDDYALNSIERAIHTVHDPEVVEFNLLTVPGITNTRVTDLVLETCADRADSLGIVDIENVFTPSTENTTSYESNLGSVDSAVSSIQTRDINNSYGCTYYPWVQIKDTRNSRLVWVPPSVVALGTFGSSEAKSELWFAPAGFTRGGLSVGSAGLPVVQVSERLTSDNRDNLYLNNVNPIAKFPTEGIVIFGQKTLQQTQSALDRINVRRLMIYIKKEVSRIAATILFDQNVPVTWMRFTSQVNPLLETIKTRFGITDFKVVLDETTTTPDLIDRNIMYAKIFIKPARAIEFIAIDFVITRTGASFDD
tara:strand:+ start:3391 stop:6336 length:2946 start_codon:yes stop_codon:yes gene_type:complete